MDRYRRLVKMLLVFLCLVIGCVNGGNNFNSRIADISDNLGRALNKAMDFGNVSYTDYNDTSKYIMEVHWDPKGFGDFYNITLFFMDLVLPKHLIPEDIELPVDEGGDIDLNKLLDKFPSLLKSYAGLLALTIIGVIFMILMPLVGVIFCCCRCCGNCGARSQPFDKKHDTCRKVILAMLLICVATLILFGVVCAFVSNKHIQEGIEELPNETREGVTDLSAYINSTDSHIRTLLTTNYKELDSSLIDVLEKSSTIISDELGNLANATSFTSLVAFAEALTRISADLKYMKTSTNSLRVNASQLNDGLRRVKNELLQALRNCPSSHCGSVKEEINRMKTTMDFDQLPDVSNTLNALSKIVGDGELLRQIQKGQDSFKKIKTGIDEKIKSNIPLVKKTLSDTGDSLQKSYSDVSQTLKDFNKMLGDNSKAPIDEAERYIKEYSKYRYYVGLIQSSILLLVIICITFGLMCGVCGKRPDGYDDDCCNKGAGSRFLMIGVAVMFFFSFFLMLITLVYFLTGSVAQRVVCDTLKSPKDNRLFNVVDRLFPMNKIGIDSNLSTIIEMCHKNESAYNVLKLEKELNVNDLPNYLEKYGVTEQIEQFKDKIKFTDHITLINKDTTEQIDKLKESGIGDISFDYFTRVLEHNITSIDLVVMATNLMRLAEQLPEGPGNAGMVHALKHNALVLEMYQKKLVEPMINTAYELTNKTKQIEQDLKLNHEGDGGGFNDILNKVEEEIKQTESYINTKGKDKITEIANNFSDKFQKGLLSYIYLVGNKTLKEVGKCGPVSNVYNATLVATCDKIFNPWNGFWVCVGWCLFLFIPCIIISVKLSTLYQKSESYPGPLVEAEYLYDAYADRDNIPLSNVPHKKGKKKKRTRAEMYETRGYAGERGDHRAPPRERDAPGGSSHPDTRYADMAPKHWDDYPNGGPPHYQSSAPIATEYERPPPYYYPGPGDRP